MDADAQEEGGGSLSVLNVGAGDIEINFNHHDRGEAARAVKMLKDMQARGYAILVRDAEGVYTRAVDVDATRGRYIVMIPEDAPLPEDAEEVRGRRKRQGVKGRTRKVSVPVRRRHAVGVARSAGG